MPTAVITPVVQSTFPDEPVGSMISVTVPTSWADALPAARTKRDMVNNARNAVLLRDIIFLLLAG